MSSSQETDNDKMKVVPDFQLGLGHIVYVLAKIDGCIKPEEMTLARSLLAE